ncbi:type II toxin-antitoxin system antitoxin HipB, partial [Escherichia coli]|uniref:type II toxin-antitoxin system antitoxin HipB n=1 Tax=Escherichia coli TaxID=562 RepID=UPI0026668D29
MANNPLTTLNLLEHDDSHVGVQLVKAQTVIGWTQSELAKKIGIKQATISNFENNPDNTTLTTFFKILQSLEL